MIIIIMNLTIDHMHPLFQIECPHWYEHFSYYCLDRRFKISVILWQTGFNFDRWLQDWCLYQRRERTGQSIRWVHSLLSTMLLMCHKYLSRRHKCRAKPGKWCRALPSTAHQLMKCKSPIEVWQLRAKLLEEKALAFRKKWLFQINLQTRIVIRNEILFKITYTSRYRWQCVLRIRKIFYADRWWLFW